MVNYTVAPNTGAAGRVGNLVIRGQNFAIVQGGANPVTSVSAARYGTLPTTSADSIVAAFGAGLATTTQVATTLPLPTTLGGTRVLVRDAAGVERLAPLFFVAAAQINYLMPEGTAVGPALVTVTAVTARIGGINAPVLFAAAQGGFVGLDQLNLEVPRELAGRGEVEVELTVDGQTTNSVAINIR